MQEALRAKDSPEFRASLGLSLMQGGQNANATDELEKAFKNNPKQTYAGMALVTLHLRNGQTAKALAVAQSLLKLNPGNPSALLMLGLGLGWLRLSSGRLGASVLMHSLWNAMTFANLVLLGS